MNFIIVQVFLLILKSKLFNSPIKYSWIHFYNNDYYFPTKHKLWRLLSSLLLLLSLFQALLLPVHVMTHLKKLLATTKKPNRTWELTVITSSFLESVAWVKTIMMQNKTFKAKQQLQVWPMLKQCPTAQSAAITVTGINFPMSQEGSSNRILMELVR